MMSSRVYSTSERFDYLQKLIHEFNVSNSGEAKRQVLANISSFAYNPINWEALNKLNAIPLLVDCLNHSDRKLSELAINGLCNLCTDPKNNYKIFNNNILNRIHKYLIKNLTNENIIISILTLFIYSHESTEISECLRFEINETVGHLQNANQNKRIQNLTQIYFQK